MSVVIVNDDNGRSNGILILIIQLYQAELFINQHRLMIVKKLEVLLQEARLFSSKIYYHFRFKYDHCIGAF